MPQADSFGLHQWQADLLEREEQNIWEIHPQLLFKDNADGLPGITGIYSSADSEPLFLPEIGGINSEENQHSETFLLQCCRYQ